MRRKIHRFLLLLLPVLVLGIAWLLTRDGTKDPQADPVPVSIQPDGLRGTTREKIFSVPGDDWLVFRIPPTAKSVRVFSRANAKGDLRSLAETPGEYGIEYRLESLSGRLENGGKFTYFAKAIPAIDAKGELIVASFYPERRELIPLGARLSQIDLEKEGIHLLKIRVDSRGEGIDSVCARVSFRQTGSKRKMSYFWERLQEKKREELAKASIHGAKGLSEEAKRALFTNRWTPLGPQGVAGEDFEEVFLYTRTDAESTWLPPEESVPKKQVLLVTRDLNAVVPIAEPGSYRFEFTVLEPGSLFRLVRFRTFGETIHQRETLDKVLDENGAVSLDLEPGLLEIDAETGFSVRVFRNGKELPREPTLVRGWITAETPLKIEVNRGAVLKMVARRLDPSADSVDIRWAGGEKSVRQSVRLIDEPSKYDRALDGTEDYRIYERNEFVLSAPDWAESLEVSSSRDAIVNFYSRPRGLKHRTRVPSDYQRALPPPDRQPVWFGVRPLDYENRIEEFQSVLLLVQTKPPEDNEDILAGIYQWEDFAPEGSARGIYLLEERDTQAPLRPKALPVAFAPLPVNREYTVDLANPPGMTSPTRRFLYRKDDTSQTLIQVFADGIPLTHPSKIAAPRGEILLPPFPVDCESLFVKSSGPVELFLNYVNLDRTTHLKRFAQIIDPGESYDFLVTKRTEEVELCTGRIYLPTGFRGGEVALQVSIAPRDGALVRLPTDGFTPHERIYLLEPPLEDIEPLVLFGSSDRVRLWQKFFVPLNNDLPPGDYRISIRYLKGPPGNFILSKVTGGVFPEARFAREAIR